MFIRSIHLRDWKAFADATFEFPDPRPKRNVVLIGAKNGYGKTSLLESIVLALFGREGLGLIGRARFSIAGQDAMELPYNEFIERAFHARSKAVGRTSMSVEVVLVRDDGEQVRIRRIWYFTSGGRHRREDEELRICTGDDDEPLVIPRLEDRSEFTRAYIAQTFLPVELAQFFLFDGEQVQRLASHDMSRQVQLGIEGVLGVPILRELRADLRDYARERRRGLGSSGNAVLDQLRREITALEAEERSLERQIAEIDTSLGPLRQKRQELVDAFASLRGSDYASLRELFEDRERCNRSWDKARDDLLHRLSTDVALAIVGTELRGTTATRLEQEAAHERWALGKREGQQNLSRFKEKLKTVSPEFIPALSKSQEAVLDERVGQAWNDLWYPPPPGCAESIRHTFLDEASRNIVMVRLKELGDVSPDSIAGLLRQVAALEEQRRQLDRRIAKGQGIDEEATRLASELKDATDQVSGLESKRSELTRSLDGLRGQLQPKRQEARKAEEGVSVAEPVLRRASKAELVADLLDSIVAEAFPSHVRDVARAMTKAYVEMAHKKLVKKIEISDDCTVKLMGGHGRDVREMDTSAGESQIFALSLIAAITEVSERSFPIVMDTPLARLDPDHRRNMLKYFTEGRSQIILLSQPDEIRGEYLDLIRPRLSSEMRIEHENLTDTVGRSSVASGYFEEQQR